MPIRFVPTSIDSHVSTFQRKRRRNWKKLEEKDDRSSFWIQKSDFKILDLFVFQMFGTNVLATRSIVQQQRKCVFVTKVEATQKQERTRTLCPESPRFGTPPSCPSHWIFSHLPEEQCIVLLFLPPMYVVCILSGGFFGTAKGYVAIAKTSAAKNTDHVSVEWPQTFPNSCQVTEGVGGACHPTSEIWGAKLFKETTRIILASLVEIETFPDEW